METTTSTGDATITLAGAVTSYRTFQSVFNVGDRVSYVIALGSEWEVGDGVLLTATTLSRENVSSSSNGGALVSFGVGAKQVWCDQSAQQIANLGLVIAFRAVMVPQ